VAFEVAKNEEISITVQLPIPRFSNVEKKVILFLSQPSHKNIPFLAFLAKKSCCFRNTQKSKQSLKCVHFFVFSSSFGIKNLS